MLNSAHGKKSPPDNRLGMISSFSLLFRILSVARVEFERTISQIMRHLSHPQANSKEDGNSQ